MRSVLGLAGREVLARLSTARVLLAFDFDGTLAPMVDDPSRAALAPSTRDGLARLGELYPVAVISGRGRADVARRLAGIGLCAVVGNHGAETGRRGDARSDDGRAAVRRWRRALEAARLEGVVVEDKGLSLSLHYRGAADRAAAARRAQAAARALDGARVVPGKLVVNVLPAGAHKGVALREVMAHAGCTRALYVGDDHTDEDAFAVGRGGVVGVRVGRRRDSAARYYLSGQGAIDRLLDVLVELRCAASATPRSAVLVRGRRGRRSA